MSQNERSIEKGATRLDAKYIDKNGNVSILRRPDDLLIVVARGVGRQSLYCPTLGLTESVTKSIALKDATPIHSVKQFLRRR